MIEIKYTGDELWERIERAIEIVEDRLRRVTEALNQAGLSYAVIDGHAVQHWVSQVDESVVRNTRDIDLTSIVMSYPMPLTHWKRQGLSIVTLTV
jgi:hypothetical protein